MGKLAGYIITLIALHLAAYFTLGVDLPGNYIMNLFNDIWAGQTLWDQLSSGLALIGGALVLAGLYFVRNEYAIYAGIGLLLGPFVFSLLDIVNALEAGGALNFFDIIVPRIVYWIFIAPLLILWAYIIVEFARGRDN